MNNLLLRTTLFLAAVAVLFPCSFSEAEDDSFIWAFRYEDKVGVHYGRVRIPLLSDSRVDMGSPFYLETLFRPGSIPNSDGSALFESSARYRRPNLSRYDFYLHYKDPEPKTRLGLRIVSFDGVTLTAELQEIVYGSSARLVKLHASDGDFYGTCEGSYLRDYKIDAGSVEITLGTETEWRSRGVRGTEYWLLIQRGGQRLYPDQRAVMDALEKGAARRRNELVLLSAADAAEPLVQARYKATNRWFRRKVEPQGTTVEPGSGDFEKLEAHIREAGKSGKPIQGEDLILHSVISDRQWSKEMPPPPEGAFARGMDKLIGIFNKGEMVAEETIVSDGKILQVSRDADYRVVQAPWTLPKRTEGAGRTPAEALSSAINEAGRVIGTRVRLETMDAERSRRVVTAGKEEGSSADEISRRAASSSTQAIKSYKVTRMEKIQDHAGGYYQCEIEYVPGKVVPR